ncbi:DedA family protein [Vibrio sp.]|nr:DedA family protein [Vibrio sp.]
MIESVLAWMNTHTDSIGVMVVGIILLSYLLEDLAIVTAAGLAVQDSMPLSMALLAIFIGISTGDLGLYYMGKSGRRFNRLREKALSNKYVDKISHQLHHHAFMSLFIMRFIPGMRTVGFTLSGFFNISVWVFLSAVLIATTLWTAFVFWGIYAVGNSEWLDSPTQKWMVIGSIFVVLLLLNKAISKRFA